MQRFLREEGHVLVDCVAGDVFVGAVVERDEDVEEDCDGMGLSAFFLFWVSGWGSSVGLCADVLLVSLGFGLLMSLLGAFLLQSYPQNTRSPLLFGARIQSGRYARHPVESFGGPDRYSSEQKEETREKGTRADSPTITTNVKM